MAKQSASGASQIIVSMDDLIPLFQERLDAGQCIRFSPRGISMLPMLRQGIDTVTLSPAPQKLKKFDIPLYRRDDGKYILHRVVKTGDTYTCIGDNQFDPEPGVRHDQIIAVVTSFTRNGREIPTTATSHQLYCRLWHYSRPLRHFWRRGMGWLRRHLHKA